MGIPLRQVATVGAYVLRQHLAGRKRYPLVLMLEPLFRCNLACAGCGKIDYPDRDPQPAALGQGRARRGRRMRRAGRRRSPAASRFCTRNCRRSSKASSRAGSSSILCTNALLLAEEDRPVRTRAPISPGRSTSTATARRMTCRSTSKASTIVPSPPLQTAKAKRLPRHHQLHAVQRRRSRARRCDSSMTVTALGIDGITVSPGYAYERAPDQKHFLNRLSDQATVPRHLPRAATAPANGRSTSRACSSTSSPATRPITARHGAIRPATCSAGSAPATCSAKATRRASVS